VLSRDAARHQAQMRAEATDRRVRGGVAATMTMALSELDETLTQMQVNTEAVVMGRLGEFGQPIIRRKADQIMEQFAQRLTDRVSRDPGQDATHEE
jgi:carbon monoxide dehydrogenase subunit G